VTEARLALVAGPVAARGHAPDEGGQASNDAERLRSGAGAGRDRSPSAVSAGSSRSCRRRRSCGGRIGAAWRSVGAFAGALRRSAAARSLVFAVSVAVVAAALFLRSDGRADRRRTVQVTALLFVVVVSHGLLDDVG